MRTCFDAVIVGAGPAGSTAAILLARGGWSVALIEKHPFPRRKVCGECIAASNLALLEALGVGTALARDAGPALHKVALMGGERQIVADLPAAASQEYPWGKALGRASLDAWLLEQAQLAGAQVLQPWSVQAIDGALGDWNFVVQATDSQQSRTLRAPLGIAAHGSWESLPACRQSRRRAHRASDLLAFKANFRNAALADGLLPVLCLDGGYGGMVMADAGVATVACCIRRDRLLALRRASPGLPAGDVIEAWLKDQCSGVGQALRCAARQGPWLAAGPIDPGVRLRADDELLRIGNAAGEAHPILGEGISMALQSAALLCANLLDGKGRAAACSREWQRAVGRRYASQWRREFVPRLRLAAVFAHLAMRPACAALLLALASSWPGLLTRGAGWGGKVRCAVDPAALVAAVPAAPAR
ncbi:FAD dependent oxidoreductase [Burkholderiales bacterium]|nr:FAD dependent oxidoreductase [Burkholderiales bacterium]